MNGRAFLVTARLLLAAPCEENRRTAAGRAYYALLHEGQVALERWGFPLLAAESLHTFVRRRFSWAVNPDLTQVSKVLDGLSGLRNTADYRLGFARQFATDADAITAVDDAQKAINLLDQMGADPARHRRPSRCLPVTSARLRPGAGSLAPQGPFGPG